MHPTQRGFQSTRFPGDVGTLAGVGDAFASDDKQAAVVEAGCCFDPAPLVSATRGRRYQRAMAAAGVRMRLMISRAA